MQTHRRVLRRNPISFFLGSCLISVFAHGGPAAGPRPPVDTLQSVIGLKTCGIPGPVPPSCRSDPDVSCRIPAAEQRARGLAPIPGRVDRGCRRRYCGNVTTRTLRARQNPGPFHSPGPAPELFPRPSLISVFMFVSVFLGVFPRSISLLPEEPSEKQLRKSKCPDAAVTFDLCLQVV